MMEVEHCEKKRKLDHGETATIDAILDTLGEHIEVGWHTLQPILENDVLHAKIPSTEMAFNLLVRWFRIIVHDQEKLRLFRQWVIPSTRDINESNECIASTTSTSCSSSSLPLILLADGLTKKSGLVEDSRVSSDLSRLNHCNPTNSEGHQVLLLQLLQHQQQQIVLLQQLQHQSPQPTNSPTITLSPKYGCSSTIVTASLQDKPKWHSYHAHCECTLGFTLTDGTTTSAQRSLGGNEGELVFAVPPLHGNSGNSTSGIPVVVHLTLCDARDIPIVCLEPFLYMPRRQSLGSSMGSDEYSDEDTMDETADDDDHDEDTPPKALPPSGNSNTPTPKQLMTIRERMLEHAKRATKTSPRIVVQQQPSIRVVWKNRRLDTPFKLRIEGLEESGNSANNVTPSKLVALAIVADHKGRLQIDAVENYVEDFTPQGLAHFGNLRMTKGTWGKEWTITFAAVVKSSYANVTIVAVSPSCPIVVKTRKNPQIRHSANGRAELFTAPPTPPPITFVERKFEAPSSRPKRHRVEDLLNNNRPTTPPTSHFEDMASLLYAAELKQQEMNEQDPSPAPSSSTALSSTSNGADSNSDKDFASFQNLINCLEDIRSKQQMSLSITEQPTPKRDSKILIVKKGKPFRVPFRLQLRSNIATTSTTINNSKYDPQNYVCVAVVKNDKGEEVAVRNNEVPFDWRGVACFAGLMVMKGTWGKTVQLTFETRWLSKREEKEKTPPWSTVRMLVVCETAPIQLMCYTKDKKGPGAL